MTNLKIQMPDKNYKELLYKPLILKSGVFYSNRIAFNRDIFVMILDGTNNKSKNNVKAPVFRLSILIHLNNPELRKRYNCRIHWK